MSEKNLSSWAFLDLVEGNTAFFRWPGCAGVSSRLAKRQLLEYRMPSCLLHKEVTGFSLRVGIYHGLPHLRQIFILLQSASHLLEKERACPPFMWSNVLLKEWWANCRRQRAEFQKIQKTNQKKSQVEEKRSDHFPVFHLINICIKEWGRY